MKESDTKFKAIEIIGEGAFSKVYKAIVVEPKGKPKPEE